jgi:hypothetical protein
MPCNTCGGGKKTNRPSPAVAPKQRTPYTPAKTGFGTPSVKMNFGGKKGR